MRCTPFNTGLLSHYGHLAICCVSIFRELLLKLLNNNPVSFGNEMLSKTQLQLLYGPTKNSFKGVVRTAWECIGVCIAAWERPIGMFPFRAVWGAA